MTNQPPFKSKTRYPKRKKIGTGLDRDSLKVEIDLLRLAIECVSAWIDQDGELSEQIRLLDGLGKAALRLGSLMKLQHGLSQGDEEYLTGLSRLLVEANEKLRREGVHE